jgi:hypothetical protein
VVGHGELLIGTPSSLRGGLGVPLRQEAPLLLLLLFDMPPTPGEPATMPPPLPRLPQEPATDTNIPERSVPEWSTRSIRSCIPRDTDNMICSVQFRRLHDLI